MTYSNDALFDGLRALGGLLADRGQSYSCVVAGGASLAALGVIERVTGDIDVMAVRNDTGDITQTINNRLGQDSCCRNQS